MKMSQGILNHQPLRVILFMSLIIVCLSAIALNNTCNAQEGWPLYTRDVLLNSLIQYIQAAEFPGSIMVSGCWGYPWFAVPGGYSPLPTNAWSTSKYYMFYPPIGWFTPSIYPFWDIYNVADPLRDYPNLAALGKSPATWIHMPLKELFMSTDPLAYYLRFGIHFYSGAALAPYLFSMTYGAGMNPAILRYLSLMGMFDYTIPARMVTLPTPTL